MTLRAGERCSPAFVFMGTTVPPCNPLSKRVVFAAVTWRSKATPAGSTRGHLDRDPGLRSSQLDTASHRCVHDGHDSNARAAVPHTARTVAILAQGGFASITVPRVGAAYRFKDSRVRTRGIPQQTARSSGCDSADDSGRGLSQCRRAMGAFAGEDCGWATACGSVSEMSRWDVQLQPASAGACSHHGGVAEWL